MKIEVVGGGCSRCDQLYASTQQALEAGGIEAELVKETDYAAVLKYRLSATPALVVDGVVKSSGEVLNQTQVAALLA